MPRARKPSLTCRYASWATPGRMCWDDDADADEALARERADCRSAGGEIVRARLDLLGDRVRACAGDATVSALKSPVIASNSVPRWT